MNTPEASQPYMSPLMFCKGAVEVTVVPGSLRGDAASVSSKPVSSYYTLTNRTKDTYSFCRKIFIIERLVDQWE